MRKDKTSIPEKYHMIFCPHCKGLGKIYENGREFQVCMVCGGLGAIRKLEAGGIAPKDKLRKIPESKF